MLEYLPWSTKLFNEMIEEYRKGQFTILDLELGGECNCNCLYCDSPNRTSKIEYSIESIIQILKSGYFNWLFICGLGEPTFGENLTALELLLNVCASNQIKCSIFTNALNITPQIKWFIDIGILHVLFKYDSFDDEVNKEILGKKHKVGYNDIFQQMKNSVIIKGNYTNIAASIVPTVYNEDILDLLTKKCIDSNIFPLLGALEVAGNAKEIYDKLVPKYEKLVSAKFLIDKIVGGQYRMPICPSTIGSIHIAANGDITVDAFSGLSCSWFWLKTPNTISLGNVNQRFDYNEIVNRIISYRKTVFHSLNTYIDSSSNIPFGGCGGDIKALLNIYKNIMQSL